MKLIKGLFTAIIFILMAGLFFLLSIMAFPWVFIMLINVKTQWVDHIDHLLFAFGLLLSEAVWLAFVWFIVFIVFG